jgi:hypothetical protein
MERNYMKEKEKERKRRGEKKSSYTILGSYGMFLII